MQIFEASLDGPVLQSQITGVWSKWFRVTLLLIFPPSWKSNLTKNQQTKINFFQSFSSTKSNKKANENKFEIDIELEMK